MTTEEEYKKEMVAHAKRAKELSDQAQIKLAESQVEKASAQLAAQHYIQLSGLDPSIEIDMMTGDELPKKGSKERG